MKTKIFFGILLMVAMGAFTQSLTDQDFLNFVRDETNLAPRFKANMHFEVHLSGETSSKSEFILYENKGKSIAIFQSPPKDKGKAILQIESKYWIYFPKTKRSTALSPMANMLGHASNADVLRPPLTSLYDIQLLDSPPKMGNRTVEYMANTRKAPYGKMIAWFGDDKLLGTEVYSRSGVLLKKTFNDEHRRNNEGNGWFATKTRILDGTNEENFTTITFSNMQILTTINESWFNPNNLGRVR